MKRPEKSIFADNESLHKLWLCRNEDRPVTTRELYNIIAELSQEIAKAEDRARSEAIWSGFGG